MHSKFLLAPALLALSIVSAAQTALPTDATVAASSVAPLFPDALRVDDVVAEALRSNPEIRSAERRIALAQSKTATARSLDDPMFQVRDWGTPLRKPWDLNQAQTMFMVQQTFIGKDKRNMRAQVSADEVEVAQAELESTRQQVAAEVRKTAADLLRNADEMRVHDRQSSLLKEAQQIALAQYTTGKVPQADVLRAQMALTRLSEHLIELDEQRDTAVAQLNALMGRRPDEPLELAGAYRVIDALPSTDDLERMAIEHRPELASLHREIVKGQDESKNTRLALKPDFTVGLGYMLMPSGTANRNAYMAELGMNLPTLNRARHDGEVRQADAATAVTQSELEARTTQVFLEIRQAQIATLSAQKRVKLYRDTLLPQAEASFKASTAAYQNNRAEFPMLIDSQNLLLDVQTAYYTASAAMDAGIAGLERAVGAPMPIANPQHSAQDKAKQETPSK